MNTDHLSRLSEIYIKVSWSELRCSWGATVKRGFDILASALGLIILSPLFAAIALLIEHESPGPVFYRGPRMGKNGKIFKILKFRTMYERPESYQGARITARDDNRITPLGHALRIRPLPRAGRSMHAAKSCLSRPASPARPACSITMRKPCCPPPM